jgi:capsular exopolysaccharide synthesis family protein
LQDTLVSAAAEDLKVRVEPNTRIIEIRYDSVDPKFAADFTNTLVSEFVEESLQARWRTSQYTSEWLGRQMQGLKAKLQASEQQLQDYVRSSGLQFTAEKENVAEEKLRQLQLELSKAQADRLARQSRFELASSVPTDALPEVLDDMTLRQYQISVTDLRRQVVELSASLTPTNPKITRLQAQIALLEGAIEKERSNITRRIRNEYETSRRREALLRADFESQSSLLTDQASRVAHYGIMKREVESSRELYESMLRRVREATVASALRASNIWVVEPAKPPDKPYKPNTTLNSALGLISGLFGGFILVLMRERADQRIKAPGDTWANLNVSELGTIPICESKLLHRPHRGASKSIGSGKDARVLGLSATSGEAAEQQIACRVELITHHDRLSIVSECFRNVLTSIMLSSPNGERPRTLVLTSAIPGDGKTMVTSNLAIALAETNLKVLLIDGDLRKPHLHQIFEVDNCAGFSDFLKELPKSPLASLVTATVIPGLSILPSGSERDPDLVHSANLPELLRRIRAEFDIVLIDTPPTLLFPDARILARNADAVILVLRAGQTTWSTARSLCRRLSEDNTPILGAILNEWNPKATGAYSDGKYYRYYGRYYSKT